jgi:hypothetical protein
MAGVEVKDAVQEQPNARTARTYARNPERNAHLVPYTRGSKETGRRPPLSRSPFLGVQVVVACSMLGDAFSPLNALLEVPT